MTAEPIAVTVDSTEPDAGPPSPAVTQARAALFAHYADVPEAGPDALSTIQQRQRDVHATVAQHGADVVEDGAERHDEIADKILRRPKKKKKKPLTTCEPTSVEALKQRVADEAAAEKQRLASEREAARLTLHMKVVGASAGLGEPGQTLDAQIAAKRDRLGKDADAQRTGLARQAAPDQATIDAQLARSATQLTAERDRQLTGLRGAKAKDLAAIEAVRTEAEATAKGATAERTAVLAAGQRQANAARMGANLQAHAIPDDDKQHEVRAEGERRAQAALADAAAKAQALQQRADAARTAEANAQAQARVIEADADARIAAVEASCTAQLERARTAARAPLQGRIDQAARDMAAEAGGLGDAMRADPDVVTMQASAAAGAGKAQGVEDDEDRKLDEAFARRLQEVDDRAQKVVAELDAPGDKDLCKLAGDVDDAIDAIDEESDLAEAQAQKIIAATQQHVAAAIARDLRAVRAAGAQALAALAQQERAAKRRQAAIATTAAADFAGLARQGGTDVTRLGTEGAKAVEQTGLNASLDLWGAQQKTMAGLDLWMYGHKDARGADQNARLARRRAVAGGETSVEIDEELATLRAGGALTADAIAAVQARKEHEHKLEMQWGVNITNDRTAGQRAAWSDKELVQLDHALQELPGAESIDNRGERLEFRREVANGGINAQHAGGLIQVYDNGARKNAAGEIMRGDEGDPDERFRGRGASAAPFGEPTFLEEVLLHELGHNTHDANPAGLEAYKKALGWRTGLDDGDLPALTDPQKADLAARKPVDVDGVRYVRGADGKLHCYNGDRIDQTMTADSGASGFKNEPGKVKDVLDYQEYFAELHKESILRPEVVHKQYVEEPDAQLQQAIAAGKPQGEIASLTRIRDARKAEFEAMRHDVFHGDSEVTAAEQRLAGTVSPAKLAAFRAAAAQAMTPEQVQRLEAQARR